MSGEAEGRQKRPRVAEERDKGADQRDEAANQRNLAAHQRDLVAERRDLAAELRDLEAEKFGAAAGAATIQEVLDHSSRSRQDAAADRRQAALDRQAGASERLQAEDNRNRARADRRASANERVSASLDELTGVYPRHTGLAALEHETAEAKRTQQPLVVAFVEVDQLRAINDSRGLAAGDRVLLEVATALREELRSYDLVIRYSADQFICAISGLTVVGAAKPLEFVRAARDRALNQVSITLGLAELQPDESAQRLVERAHAALCRERQKRTERAVLMVRECGDLLVDERTQSVTRAGAEIALTVTEFKMLSVLVRHRHQIVSKGQLLDQVWGYDADDHVLAVHMSSLRRKLEAHGPRIVQTVRGTGYVLRP